MRLARDDTEAALQDQRDSLINARQAKDPQVLSDALAVSAYVLAVAGRADEAQPILSELFGSGAFDRVAATRFIRQAEALLAASA